MFRPMRREKQLLPEKEARAILESATSGVLALIGDGGYPYAVPLSYVCDGDKLYFHSALEGHKIDAVRNADKASFCVVAQDEIVPAEFTTYFKSVIAFGRVRLMEDGEEKITTLRKLAERYSPDQMAAGEREIETSIAHTAMIEFTVEHLTGKEATELAKRRK